MALPADFKAAVRRAKSTASKQRIVSSTGDGSFQTFGDDLLGQTRGTALNRRKQRTNHDIASLNAAVFSAIRWREQAIARPAVVLERRIGRTWTELGRTDEPGIHPLLDAIRSVNAGLTARHGMMGIERGKLTNGSHIWVKVRAGNRPTASRSASSSGTPAESPSTRRRMHGGKYPTPSAATMTAAPPPSQARI